MNIFRSLVDTTTDIFLKSRFFHRKIMISQNYYAYTTEFDRIIYHDKIDILRKYTMREEEFDRESKFEIDFIVNIKELNLNIEKIRSEFLKKKLMNDEELVVTLLIDHSGSMAEGAILQADLLTAALVSILIGAGAKVEVLGFTTSSWRGGDSRKLWLKHGKPRMPGRLCDLLHVIYREADSTEAWSDDVVRGMFTAGLLKENIDGEAVLWAERRLLATPASRRVLFVLSDGAPVDDSTLLANGGPEGKTTILTDHLKAVLARIKLEERIALCGISLCSPAYSNYVPQIAVLKRDDVSQAVSSALEFVLGNNKT